MVPSRSLDYFSKIDIHVLAAHFVHGAMNGALGYFGGYAAVRAPEDSGLIGHPHDLAYQHLRLNLRLRRKKYGSMGVWE